LVVILIFVLACAVSFRQLAIDFFCRLFSFANIDPPRRSRRLQGLPPENMEGDIPLPPHSTEQPPQPSEVQSTTTPQEEVPIPIENFRIVSESPEAYRIPEGYERQILHLNSAGEFVVINPSNAPAGSPQHPLPNDPFWTENIVRSPPRLVRDLYGMGEGTDIPFSYTVPLNHFTDTTTFTATPTVPPSTPPVGANVTSVGPRPSIPLQKSHSTLTPHIPTIPAGNAVFNQTPIGTPVTPRPNLPFGFRALNASTTTTTKTTAQIIPGSSIPIQQPGGTVLGGSNPIDNIGQYFTSGPQILGTLPQNGGHPPIGGQIPFRGYPHAGGKPQVGVHHQPQGQNMSIPPNPWSIPFQGNPHASTTGQNVPVAPNPWSVPFQGNPHASTGKTVPATSNPWSVPFSENPHSSAGQKSQTPQQPPYGKMPNPTHNPQNPSGYPPLMHTSQNTSNPIYLGQNQPHMRGPTSNNYPHSPVLGPTGVPLPH